MEEVLQSNSWHFSISGPELHLHWRGHLNFYPGRRNSQPMEDKSSPYKNDKLYGNKEFLIFLFRLLSWAVMMIMSPPKRDASSTTQELLGPSRATTWPGPFSWSDRTIRTASDRKPATAALSTYQPLTHLGLLRVLQQVCDLWVSLLNI